MTILDEKGKLQHDSPNIVLEGLGSQKCTRKAELSETDKHLRREIGGRKRAEQINRVLFRISNAVNTTKDLNELYGSIHRVLGEVIDLTNFFIAIYHKESNRVSFPYFVDQYDSGKVYADQINEENSLTGEILITQKAVFHKRADLQLRVAQNRLIGTAPETWIGVPLKIKGEVIGIMSTQCYEDQDRFAPIDLDILNSISDQVALAIERKRNEQSLIASEKKYRTIIESIEDGYYEIDLKGNLTLVNQALCKMLGYSDNDLLGKHTAGFMSEDSVQKINESFTAVLVSKQPGKTLELELILSDGESRYVETVVSNISNDESEFIGFRGIARDITERKIAERSRKILEDQLQQAQRLESLGTLAGGIAHDFNNLLMGIQGRTELMLNDLNHDHLHHSQLNTILKYLESAANLTTRLLGFARGGKYQVQPVDLNLLIEKSIQMFGRTKKEITINCCLEKELRAVEIDSGQIEQVVINLLVNAAQAMPGGGDVCIATSLISLNEKEAQVYNIRAGHYARMVLSDTGKGMDKETMGKIFDPFFTTKEIGHGTGLGLAMVYGIIRNHSGAISVESELNKGTTFLILLPLSNKTISGESEIAVALKKGSERILLVDDEPMILEVGKEILAALGYDVLTASTGQEALDIYHSNLNHIDLFIIDMIMPHMSGGELFDKLRELNPAVRVLLASGYSLEGEAREIMKRGCRGFIQKPFSISELSTKLRKILS